MKSGKSIRQFIAFFILCTLTGVNLPASAQSTDPANPTPVSSSVISGKGNGGTVKYYYKINAGPGQLGVTFNAKTFSYAELVTVQILDGQTKLLMIDLSADSDGPQKSDTVQLSSQKSLLLCVTLKPRIESFQVKLSGALQTGSPAPAAAPQANLKVPKIPGHAHATLPAQAEQQVQSAPVAASMAAPPSTDTSFPAVTSPCDAPPGLSSKKKANWQQLFLKLSSDGQVLGLNTGSLQLEMQDGTVQEISLTKVKKLRLKR